MQALNLNNNATSDNLAKTKKKFETLNWGCFLL